MTEDRRPRIGDGGRIADGGRAIGVESQVYKFQRLEIYQLALTYIDLTYDLAARLPRSEDFGLKS